MSDLPDLQVTVAERGQITLPKAVRDALGLAKGSTLSIEVDGSRIVLRKNVDDALRRVKGRFRLAAGFAATDDALRALNRSAPAAADAGATDAADDGSAGAAPA